MMIGLMETVIIKIDIYSMTLIVYKTINCIQVYLYLLRNYVNKK